MAPKIPPVPPHSVAAKVNERLIDAASTARAQADEHDHQAAAAARNAVADAKVAVGFGFLARMDGKDAAAELVDAGKHAVTGAGLAAAAAIVKATEIVGDLFGAALQRLGKGLISVGNFLRQIGGGSQVLVGDLERREQRQSLSDKLRASSRDQMALAGSSLTRALDDLVSAGGNVAHAAWSVLDAATHLAEAAAHGGSGAALRATAVAVDAARAAVEAARHGADGAGAILQEAGKALIAAGNAVNAPSGTDTAVLVKC